MHDGMSKVSRILLEHFLLVQSDEVPRWGRRRSGLRVSKSSIVPPLKALLTRYDEPMNDRSLGVLQLWLGRTCRCLEYVLAVRQLLQRCSVDGMAVLAVPIDRQSPQHEPEISAFIATSSEQSPRMSAWRPACASHNDMGRYRRACTPCCMKSVRCLVRHARRIALTQSRRLAEIQKHRV